MEASPLVFPLIYSSPSPRGETTCEFGWIASTGWKEWVQLGLGEGSMIFGKKVVSLLKMVEVWFGRQSFSAEGLWGRKQVMATHNVLCPTLPIVYVNEPWWLILWFVIVFETMFQLSQGGLQFAI